MDCSLVPNTQLMILIYCMIPAPYGRQMCLQAFPPFGNSTMDMVLHACQPGIPHANFDRPRHCMT